MIGAILFLYFFINATILFCCYVYDKMNNVHKEDFYYEGAILPYIVKHFVPFAKFCYRKLKTPVIILLFGIFIVIVEEIIERVKKNEYKSN